MIYKGDNVWRVWFKNFRTVIRTIDHDGEIRFRFVKRVGNKVYCRAIAGWVELRRDGTIKNKSHSYCEHWEAV